MVCLDTTFLIDVTLGRSLNRFEKLIDGEEIITVASPSIIELIKGLHLKRNLKNIKEKESDKINNILSSLTILNLDKGSAVLAGKIEAELINKGEMIDIEDIMIGAIVLHNNETLVTRNVKHFQKIPGLKIISY